MYRSNALRVLIQAAAVQPVQPVRTLQPHRTKSTQVRTEPIRSRPSPICSNIYPQQMENSPRSPNGAEARIPIQELPEWVQAHTEAVQFQQVEKGKEWSPEMILNQEYPTVDLAWDPKNIMEPPGQKVHSQPIQTKMPPPSTTYRYTLDPSTLPKLRANQLAFTPEQRKFYEDNGYIVIKKLVKDHDLERYEKRFKDFANSRLRIPEGMVVQKEVTVKGEKLSEYNLYKLQELYTDDVLFDYCRDPNILDYVQQFTGENVLSVHSMFINKPPIASSTARHPLHQEIHYFPIRPEDRIVCTWMPLEPTNRENGCLVVVPASHKDKHLEHDYPDWKEGVNKFYYGIKDTSLADKRMHVEMEPGDCLFFHPLTIHGSGINRSKGFRKAFSCHFASADCDFIQTNGTIQEKLANELLSIYVDKLSSDTVSDELKQKKIDYPTMWKLRSRLVRGEGNFKRA